MRIKLTLFLTVGLVAAASLSAASVSAQPKTHPARAAHAKHSTARDPEFSALQPLAGRIEVLGETKYPTVFAGDRIANGKLYVYIVHGRSGPFLKAVAKADRPGLPYSVGYVSRNFASQLASANWIKTHWPTLRRDGVELQWWGPNAIYDAVRVQLATPTRGQLAHLGQLVTQVREGHRLRHSLRLQAQMPVTESTYKQVATAVLRAMSPSPGGLAVAGTVMTPLRELNYTNDNKPFDGADKIYYTLNNTGWCSGNFAINAASDPGKQYMMTAAHCSGEQTGHDFYTCYTTSGGNCNYNVGTVQTVYWSGDDFELIPSSVEGWVWNDSDSTKWSVNGYMTPATGDYLTTNGARNGAVFNNLVTNGWSVATCYTAASHTVCNAFAVEKTSPNCEPGDSGGTILQRESDNYHIYAAGIIQAGGSGGGFYDCLGQAFSYIRSRANIRLIWGN